MTDMQAEAKRAVTVREIEPRDAEAAAALSGELGYPAAADVMADRIRRLADLHDHAVFVACLDGTVAAWIDVGAIHHLQAEPYGEIGGLVVSSAHRGAGIGRILVARAEEWARSRGLARMVVRSRVSRADAHRFYSREGYELTKTSAVFSKVLS